MENKRPTCGFKVWNLWLKHKRTKLPVRQDKLKNENTGSVLDSHY